MLLPTRAPTAFAAAICLALGLWLSDGALAVTNAQGARLGWLPPLWFLVALMVVAIGFVTTFRPSAERSLPLLFASALILPWLPFRIPAAFLIWTGTLRAWVWAGALIASWMAQPVIGVRFRDCSWIVHPRRAPYAAAALAAVFYSAAAWRLAPVLPGGDEPHYLIITQSLLRDRDLKIENNHRRGDYREYFPGTLNPDYLRRGQDHQIYSIHAPGLPAVIAPAFAAFGHPGVTVFLAIASALTTGFVWHAAYLVTGQALAAWFGWASLALTVPWLFHSFAVYPEALGAALVLSGIMPLISGKQLGAWRWTLHGAALALLPWLHTRYAVAALSLAACLLARLWRQPQRLRAATAFLAAPIASAMAWFGFFYMIYGTISPSAPYGSYTQSHVGHIPRGLIGLLIDQQFGLLPTAPIFAFALAGWFPLWRQDRRFAVELMVLCVPYALLVAAYYMWWGGWSAPARFLVPALLPLAVPASLQFARARVRTTRAVGVAALFLSIAITMTFTVVEQGRLAYTDRGDAAPWVLHLSPLVDMTRILPTMFRGSLITALVSATAWVAAITVAIAALRLLERRRVEGAAFVLAVPSTMAISVMALATIVWAVEGRAGLTPAVAKTTMLSRYNPSRRPIALADRPFRLLELNRSLGSLRVSSQEVAQPGPGDPLLVLEHLPAGTYLLERHPSQHADVLTLAVGRHNPPIQRWPVADPSEWQTYRFTLPVAVGSSIIAADPSPPVSLTQITVRPVSLVPPARRISSQEALAAIRYGTHIVYVLNGVAYLEPEGIWIGGRASAELVMVSDPTAAARRLYIRNAPVVSEVLIAAAEAQHALRLRPGEERLIDLPSAVTSAPIRLKIAVSGAFRPSDMTPGESDTRWLGCWIEIR